ncbi:MAG: WYL domain-containing transcriptional regulator [bacterium]
MRGQNLIKFLKAIELLSRPEGTTIKEIAEYTGLHRRSVDRLIKLIEGFGFPLYEDKIPLEREKRWKLEESYFKKLPNMNVPNINLSLAEILSLYLMKSGGKLFKGTDLEQHINSAFGKLGLFLPDQSPGQLDKIKALFINSAKYTKDYSGKEEVIDQLTDAMLKKESCFVKYHSFYDDAVKEFKMDPLHFFENKGGLYLFVNTTSFGEIRTLAVERIQEIKGTGVTFEYPKDFTPEELLEAAFDIIYDDPVDIKIWFSADQARYIEERKWSSTQKIEEQKDGSIILSMNTSGWWDIKRWVLSYGGEAKVIEPKELREEIAGEIEALRNSYKK